jgi:hypothetical protein
MGHMSDMDIEQREGRDTMQRFGFTQVPNGGWVNADEAMAEIEARTRRINELEDEILELKQAAKGIIAEFEDAAEITEFGGKEQPERVDIDGPDAGRI